MIIQQLRRFLIAVLLIGALFFTLNSGYRVLAQEPENSFITSPTEGEVVSGLITVTGSAAFDDFQKYEILLQSGDQLSWAATVFAPVINGTLAWVDTRTFLDGTYQMVIRRVDNNSNYTDVVGPSITIENGTGSALAYPEIDSSPLYPIEGFALARLRNCGGVTMDFDYHSPDGFCSGGDLELRPKDANLDYCPAVDLRLIPCEYRGTAIGQGNSAGANYSFVAEAGKVYELDFPGGDRIFINQIEGDQRADTDTGGQSTGQAAVASAGTGNATNSNPEGLPQAGQGFRQTNLPFVSVGIGFIVLLLIAGVVAVRRRGDAV